MSYWVLADAIWFIAKGGAEFSSPFINFLTDCLIVLGTCLIDETFAYACIVLMRLRPFGGATTLGDSSLTDCYLSGGRDLLFSRLLIAPKLAANVDLFANFEGWCFTIGESIEKPRTGAFGPPFLMLSWSIWHLIIRKRKGFPVEARPGLAGSHLGFLLKEAY